MENNRFWLTFEGTSRLQYTTQNSRGTQGYRAIELLGEQSFVTKASDIWALGCIFYQLAFKEKAFRSDFKVYDYFHTRRKPEIPPLPVDERTAAFARELVYRTLEIDWWQRPAASDILSLLDFMSKRTTSISHIAEAASEMTDSSSSSSTLPSSHHRDLPEATSIAGQSLPVQASTTSSVGMPLI